MKSDMLLLNEELRRFFDIMNYGLTENKKIEPKFLLNEAAITPTSYLPILQLLKYAERNIRPTTPIIDQSIVNKFKNIYPGKTAGQILTSLSSSSTNLTDAQKDAISSVIKDVCERDNEFAKKLVEAQKDNLKNAINDYVRDGIEISPGNVKTFKNESEAFSYLLKQLESQFGKNVASQFSVEMRLFDGLEKLEEKLIPKSDYAQLIQNEIQTHIRKLIINNNFDLVTKQMYDSAFATLIKADKNKVTEINATDSLTEKINKLSGYLITSESPITESYNCANELFQITVNKSPEFRQKANEVAKNSAVSVYENFVKLKETPEFKNDPKKSTATAYNLTVEYFKNELGSEASVEAAKVIRKEKGIEITNADRFRETQINNKNKTGGLDAFGNVASQGLKRLALTGVLPWPKVRLLIYAVVKNWTTKNLVYRNGWIKGVKMKGIKPEAVFNEANLDKEMENISNKLQGLIETFSAKDFILESDFDAVMSKIKEFEVDLYSLNKESEINFNELKEEILSIIKDPNNGVPEEAQKLMEESLSQQYPGEKIRSFARNILEWVSGGDKGQEFWVQKYLKWYETPTTDRAKDAKNVFKKVFLWFYSLLETWIIKPSFTGSFWTIDKLLKGTFRGSYKNPSNNFLWICGLILFIGNLILPYVLAALALGGLMIRHLIGYFPSLPWGLPPGSSAEIDYVFLFNLMLHKHAVWDPVLEKFNWFHLIPLLPIMAGNVKKLKDTWNSIWTGNFFETLKVNYGFPAMSEVLKLAEPTEENFKLFLFGYKITHPNVEFVSWDSTANVGRAKDSVSGKETRFVYNKNDASTYYELPDKNYPQTPEGAKEYMKDLNLNVCQPYDVESNFFTVIKVEGNPEKNVFYFEPKVNTFLAYDSCNTVMKTDKGKTICGCNI